MADPFMGEIRMFAGFFAPAGWMFCSGQLLPISEYDALFTLLGTQYGGDGQENFALPNLQSRVPIHFGSGSEGIDYPQAQMAGTETVTLTTQQIPNHTHNLLGSTANGSQVSPANNVLASSTVIQLYAAESPDGAMAPTAITPVGGSQPHENCQPFLCINYIISLFGIYPQQS